MSEAAVLWIVGTLVTVVLGLGGLLLSHFRDCRDFRVKLAEHNGNVDAKLEQIIRDVGDSETGLRGGLHKLRSEISPFIIRAQMQKRRP